ncbi:peptidase S9 [Lysobacter helvus]|nr:peptidase S9 [Lysobacter helvus]
MHEWGARARMAALVLACAWAGQAGAQAPDWKVFLKRASIEQIQVSPDGTRVAVAERIGESTQITIRNLATMAAEVRFDPGTQGEVGKLRWIDDDRVLLSANRTDSKYKVAFVRPAMWIVSRDGRDKYLLPSNFLATIEGDPNHLLVHECSDWKDGKCFDEVRKAEIGHLARTGEKVIVAPDRESELFADRHGNVRFSISEDDKAMTRLQVHTPGQEGWTLINDSEKSGLHVYPLGITADGEHAYLEAERATGASAIERYDFATGARTQVHQDPESDATRTIYAFDGVTPIGAYFRPTHPVAVVWDSTHPDAAAIKQILAAFPGRVVAITSATRDRNKAIVKTFGDRDPGTYYLFDRAAKKATLIARSRAWLPENTLPPSRDVSLVARDGMPLHGVLTLPPGKERNLPMIVLVHGGPHGPFDDATFDQESALIASQGYAVLRVNFRGSGGYGKSFETAGYKQWGRAMQDDVTDATKWAIAQGIADAGRVCVYGASYGGYSALMGAVREPALYRCAASYAGPLDLAKMYKWGGIRRSDYGMEYLARVLGKDETDLAARSPAKQVASIKVPVLIGHGRLDGRVDVAHSRAMVKAMKKAGLAVESIEYPNEGHGLNIDADEADFYTKLLAFFARNTAPATAASAP